MLVPGQRANQIVDHLVVRANQMKTNSVSRGPRPLLCLAGPPGVGKSRVANYIGNHLGLDVQTVPLDQLTSVDALLGSPTAPGVIRNAASQLNNAAGALVLRNIDALDQGSNPPPAAFIQKLSQIETLRQFHDRSSKDPLDLSKILLIATARWLSNTTHEKTIEHLDLIELDGYMDDDKINVARDTLLPNILHEYGFPPDAVQLDEDTIGTLVRSYTTEPGTVTLEHLLRLIVRRCVSRDFPSRSDTLISVTVDELSMIIGRPRSLSNSRRRRDIPGLTFGSVVTPTGGVLDDVEAVQMPGSGKIQVLEDWGIQLPFTRESHFSNDPRTTSTSYEAPYKVLESYIRSHLSELGVSTRSLEEFDVHVSIPKNPLPQDGGSLAIAATIATVSVLLDRAVDTEVLAVGGMTGHGRIRRTYGMGAKILAAHRGGIRRVLLPRENEHQLGEIPEVLHDAITFIPVENVGQAIAVALR
jgi:ATP-dependent Lon protease